MPGWRFAGSDCALTGSPGLVSGRGQACRAAGASSCSMAALSAHLGHRPRWSRPTLFRLINQLPSPPGAPLLGIMQLGALVAVASSDSLQPFSPGATGWHRCSSLPELRHGRCRRSCSGWSTRSLPRFAFLRCCCMACSDEITLGWLSGESRCRRARHDRGRHAVHRAICPAACWLIVGAVAVARAYVGLHLPVDIIGGLALGTSCWRGGQHLARSARSPPLTRPAAAVAGISWRAAGTRSRAPAGLTTCGAERPTGEKLILVKTLSWDELRPRLAAGMAVDRLSPASTPHGAVRSLGTGRITKPTWPFSPNGLACGHCGLLLPRT